MSSASRGAAAFLASLVVSSISVTAQGARVIEIDSRAPCEKCIESKLIATLTAPEATSSDNVFFSQDSRGLIYAVDWAHQPWSIKVFDTQGRFIKTIGRNGEGPGEYKLVRPPLFGLGDTAAIVDMSGRRLTYLSPSGNYLKSYRLTTVRNGSSLVVMNNGLAVAGMVGTRDRAGFPLHYLDREAEPVKSFGLDVPVMNPNRRKDFGRLIAFSRPDGIWSSYRNRYIIEQWNRNGVRLRTFKRTPDWFVNSDSYKGPSSVNPPPSSVHAIWEDSRGFLWIAFHVRGRNWRRTNPRAKTGDMIKVTSAEKHLVFDTLIEVIDPRSGKLVASQRFDDFMVTDAAHQPFASFHEDPGDTPAYRLWRFQLSL